MDVSREAANGLTHLVTRETGAAVRASIVARLRSLQEGTLLVLDLSGVGIIDFSCADESLAKLLLRLNAGEYGDKHLCLQGLGASQRENIQVALERKKLPALLLEPDGGVDCLGTLTPYLRETLAFLRGRGAASARELADALGLELTAASTRLINLHRLRLVTRRERAIGEGGREFVYERVRPASVTAAGGGAA